MNKEHYIHRGRVETGANMRDPKRIPVILARIQAIWEKNPELRLGQLIAASMQNARCSTLDPFYIEDRVLAECIEKLEQDHGKRLQEKPVQQG